jgi:hypothetical protein
MGIFNEFNKKEKPVFTGSRFGFGSGGGAAAGAAAFSVSGGTKITSGSYDYHVFTSDGTFEVTGQPGPARILVIAAGGTGGAGFGGNGNYGGGGGGAGGIAHAPDVTLSTGSHTVTVGQPAPNTAGGVMNDAGPPYPAAAGGSSTFGHNGSSAEFPYGVKVNGGTPGGNSGNDPNYDPQGSSAAQTGGSTGGAGARNWPNPSSPNYSLAGAVTALTSPSDWTFYANAGGPAGTGGPANAAGAGGGGAGGTGGVPPANNQAGGGGAGQAFPSFPGPVLSPAIPTAPTDPQIPNGRTAFETAVGAAGLYGGGGGGACQFANAGGTNPMNDPGSSGGINGGGGGTGGGGPSPYPYRGASGVNHTGGGGGGASTPRGNDPMAVGGKGFVVVRVDTAS